MLRKIAIFPNDNNPDTNQWPIDPMPNPASHGGAEFPIELRPPEIDLIKRVNSDDPTHTVDEKIKWAVRNIVGGIYYAKQQSQTGEDLPPWYWAAVIMGSGPTADKTNIVNVLEVYRGKSRIETIPIRDNYDGYSPRTHPHLFHRILVTNRRGCFDSPAGLFWMPLFEGKYRRKPALRYSGMWVKNAYLGGLVETVEPPATTLAAAIRRTVIRQKPSADAAKNGVLQAGEAVTVIAIVGDWAQIPQGYVNRNDIKM